VSSHRQTVALRARRTSACAPHVHVGFRRRCAIRWVYPIVGGVIAEGITIALIALLVAITGHGGPGPDGAMDPVAQRIAAVTAATAGSLLCYIMGWWAARHAGARFERHGTMTGATAGFLTLLGVIFSPSGQVVYYIVAVIMKVVAGTAGGRMAARLSA
jgi:hypothetical protein